jgi:hypothetical protein
VRTAFSARTIVKCFHHHVTYPAIRVSHSHLRRRGPSRPAAAAAPPRDLAAATERGRPHRFNSVMTHRQRERLL